MSELKVGDVCVTKRLLIGKTRERDIPARTVLMILDVRGQEAVTAMELRPPKEGQDQRQPIWIYRDNLRKLRTLELLALQAVE